VPSTSEIDHQPQTLLEAVRYFSDPDRALAFVVPLRWPDGRPECPRCWSKEAGFLAPRRIWKCKNPKCRKQFSAKQGTIFEDSPLGWDKWLPAIWLLANSKNSVSSYELARALGVTQKTAWFLFHRIRKAMESHTFVKMSGPVEVDETAIGGKAKFMHKNVRERRITGRGGVDKAIVQGVVERGGEVRAEVVDETTALRLQSNVRRWVSEGAAVYTDEATAYVGLERYGFAHKSVNHSVEYVSGDVSTNAVENFWSILKRALKGTQIHVDPEHLHRYVNERAFAYNHRAESDLTRMRLVVQGVRGRRLTWSALTSD
jgi:transposase-like protein